MEVEIISRQIIRPSSPTPDHLKSFSLSIFDQFAAEVYTPLILFYTEHVGFTVEGAFNRLKTSLSETLKRFYPLAGRIKDNIRIECNDEGVEYLEAQVRGVTLRDVLALPELEALNRFLPVEIVSVEAYSGKLLLVQVSVFECGGIAIGICISHKVADAAAMSFFIKCWAASGCGGCLGGQVGPPDFTVAALFPPSDMFAASHPYEVPQLKCTSRRYGFIGSKIAALRMKSSSEGAPHPTRVEAVCALIWKCAIKASQSKTKSSSVLAQTVNLRTRTDPPLPDTSIGNLHGFYTVRVEELDKNDLRIMVAKMRTGLVEYTGNYARNVRGPHSLELICEATKQGGDLVKEEGFTLYIFTSWCKLELYEADFGWGKPDWTSICSSEFKNTMVLMDARDGEGIEAWVTLTEDDMVLFEQDQELLSFACPNPNVLLDVNCS